MAGEPVEHEQEISPRPQGQYYANKYNTNPVTIGYSDDTVVRNSLPTRFQNTNVDNSREDTIELGQIPEKYIRPNRNEASIKIKERLNQIRA
jgi:hypothetical protein